MAREIFDIFITVLHSSNLKSYGSELVREIKYAFVCSRINESKAPTNGFYDWVGLHGSIPQFNFVIVFYYIAPTILLIVGAI